MLYELIPFIILIDCFSILPTKIYLIYNRFCVFILFPAYKPYFSTEKKSSNLSLINK